LTILHYDDLWPGGSDDYDLTISLSTQDSQVPVITLIGANPMDIYKGSAFTDPGATVTDNKDSTRTIAGSGTVNTATVGIYTLTYTATDVAGNLAVPVTRTVNVVLDPAADEDEDGLSNGQELTLGTDPYKKDTDGDGVNDPVEVADGTNPKDATSFKSLSQGLVAYYPFNGNAKDESGNGHQGTLVNSTVSESGLAEAGNSLRISGGMDSWMAVADSSLFRPRGFTISMWIYNNLSDDSGVRYVCGKNYEQMEIHLSNSVNSKSGIRFIPTNGCYVDTLAGTPASQWFHLVCIAGEGSEGGKIYINGVEVPVSRLGSVDGAQPINLGSDPFYLGRRTENGWQHLDGRMDNVRVYGRTLSASEIGQLYQTESGNLDSDGDGLTDAWENGFGRYEIILGSLTWEQAKSDAILKGGHLATITSPNEANFLMGLFGAGTIGSSNLTLFSENFDSITSGSNTTTTGAATPWIGNSNFPSVMRAYQAGGAVKLGSSLSYGSLTSRALDLSGNGGAFTVRFKVKGWTMVEGQIKVTPSGLPTQTVAYTSNMAGSFEEKSLSFTGGTTGMTLTLATTAKRAYLDDVVIETTGSVGTGLTDLWLGGSDSATEGSWKWVTGEPWSYTNWASIQPDGGPEQNYLRYKEGWDDWFGTPTVSGFPVTMRGYLLERGFPSNPSLADTDGDGKNDNEESIAGTDPNNPKDPTPSDSTGLIAFYRFDGNADDSLGNQPPLTFFGSRSFIPDGLSGGALRTDGDRSIWYNGGGYFSPAFLENSKLTEATFVFWTRNDASGGPLSPAHTEEDYLEIGYVEKAEIGSRALGDTGTFGNITVRWSDWKMFTLTVSNKAVGSEWTAYLNGTEYYRGSTTEKLLPSPNIKFGSHTWNEGGSRSARMTVEWDNLRIYNKSLSVADIQALYRQDSPNSDNEAPVITLIGANPMEIYKGSGFTDSGATVTDNRDATRAITGSGTVNTATVGIYTLTYTATDAAGNLALPVTRTVNVVLDPAADEDGDGLTNGTEISGGTNPYQKDSDGDGVNDPVEIADGTDPKDATSYNSLNKGLVAYYPFNGNAKDASGNGNDASVVGASLTTDRGGVANAAYSFNGWGNYIQLPGNRFLDNSVKVTISAWYRFQGNQSGQIFASGDTRPGYDPYTMRIGPGGFEDLSVADTSAYRTIKANGSLDYRDGVWRHIVMVLKELDSSTSQLLVYLDGCLVTTTNMSPKLTIRYDTDMVSQIGAIHSIQFWKGQLDDFRFYNRDLSATDVAQLYQQEAGNLDSDGDGLTDAWERGDGRYQIISGNFTWDQAKADAEARGGHLATFTSSSEWNQFLSIYGLGLTMDLRIGWEADTDSLDNWHWVTGELGSFANWDAGQPDRPRGNGEDSVVLYGRGASKIWHDYYKWVTNFGYLLEYGYPTDPTKADTDGDGFNDKVESLAGTDPNSATVFPNPDWDFSFGFSNINEAGAETYLTATSGVRKYSEWQNPPATYWGPTSNGIDASLTYRVTGLKKIRAARLKTGTDTYNFPWPGYFGSGKGWSSIWGSKDGSSWVQLMDNPMPTDNVGRWMAYDQLLPSNLLGGTELWIQIRLRVTEAYNSSYTTAQFGRGSSANSQRIFEVKLDYDGLIPETSQAAINSTRLTQSSSSASGYSSSLDSDGDGQTDAMELAAGTDPSSANSRFTLRMSSGGAGPAIRTLATGDGAKTSGVMTLTWPSVPGKIYTIERSTDLISWPVLDTVEGATGASSTSYEVMADGVRAFYRVGIPTP
jgi:hypothetical protein